MPTTRQFTSALGAVALAAQPSLAAAQDSNCITEAELSDTAIYAVPGLVSAMRVRCGASLSSRGFLATGGADLSKRYAVHQEAAWPRTRSTLFKLASQSKSGTMQYIDLIAQLPDEQIRPLLEAMLTEGISEKFAVKNCGKVERVLEAIAPIQPDVAGPLIAVVFSLAEVKDPPICPLEPA